MKAAFFACLCQFLGLYIASVIQHVAGATEQQAAAQATGYATSTVPSGKPFPLFNTCRTNIVEGENYATSVYGM